MGVYREYNSRGGFKQLVGSGNWEEVWGKLVTHNISG